MNIIKHTIFLITTIIFTNCNLPNRDFPPNFTTNKDTIYSNIKRITQADSIIISGIRAPLDDTFYLALTVTLINIKNWPKQSDSIHSIQKKIAQIVKNNLIDKSQYQSYIIYNCQNDTIKTKLGKVTSSITNGKEFKSVEL